MTRHNKKDSTRKLAEKVLQDKQLGSRVTESDAELTKLVHELQVHQIELEMQNEQLREIQLELEQSRDLYDFSPVGYITISFDGIIKDINLTGIRMMGASRSQLKGCYFQNFIATEDCTLWSDFFRTVMNESDRKIHHLEINLLRADDTQFNSYIDGQYYKTINGIDELRFTFSDNTQMKLAEQERSIAAIAFESQEGMFITDADSKILRVNHAFTKITGYSDQDLIGNNPRMFNSNKHNEKFYAAMWDSINTTGSWQGEIWNRRKNGEIYPVKLTISAVTDSNGKVTNYVAGLIDITLSKQAEQKIHEMAYHDPLTGLPNRRLMLDRIYHAMTVSRRTKCENALLFLDLDHFKDLNDTLGHNVGDILLEHVAARLKDSIREGDAVSRFGGDEFVVLLEGLSSEPEEAAGQAEDIANKILSCLNKPYQLGEHNYTSSTSIGITLFKGGTQKQEEELLKQADIAMYQAKHDGRNALCFFDPQMQTTINARIALERELNQAIEEEQFQLYYQLQVDQLGNPLGAEALIRWNHPERGLIYPLTFIPLAEKNGTILIIGQWVLDAACAQLKVWQNKARTRDLNLSINVSAKQFHQPDFISRVFTAIKSHNVNPERLKIELTEGLLLYDIEETIRKMNKLAELGILFSLDDFGTGYSSLQYLKRLPLFQLKIDKSFVQDIVADPNDQAIVSTIISMADSLGLNVIAEGVETEAQCLQLLKQGCEHFQGYLFSKPVPIDKLIKT